MNIALKKAIMDRETPSEILDIDGLKIKMVGLSGKTGSIWARMNGEIQQAEEEKKKLPVPAVAPVPETKPNTAQEIKPLTVVVDNLAVAPAIAKDNIDRAMILLIVMCAQDCSGEMIFGHPNIGTKSYSDDVALCAEIEDIVKLDFAMLNRLILAAQRVNGFRAKVEDTEKK